MRKTSLAVALTAAASTSLWLMSAMEIAGGAASQQPPAAGASAQAQRATGANAAAAPKPANVVKHVAVFHESGRYGGWPANHGAWSWGNELLVGFDDGELNMKQSGHTLTRTVGPKQKLARSLDGGETWRIEEPDDLRLPRGTNYQETYPPGEGRELTDPPGGFDFTAPDSAFTARMTMNPGVSRFYYSKDRGHTWAGPYKLPNFGEKGTAARTDYIVNGKHDLSLFLTLAKANGKEGKPGMVRTRDGGKTWNLVAQIGPEPDEKDYAIMPATVRIGPRELLTAIRHRGHSKLYRSTDEGATWKVDGVDQPTGRGNPASLTRLKDGRLVLVYGFRAEPYGIRARVSTDSGKTWQPEVALRVDGGNTDLGYPRTLERPDGKLVTIYYYNTDPTKERFIGATIWQP